MRSTEMFAGPFYRDDDKAEPPMFHFYPHPGVVKMCGCKRVFKVRVEEASEATDETYWSWWDLDSKEEPKFTHTYPKRLHLDICFPAGIKGEEDRGKGLALPVNIVVLEEVR